MEPFHKLIVRDKSLNTMSVRKRATFRIRWILNANKYILSCLCYFCRFKQTECRLGSSVSHCRYPRRSPRFLAVLWCSHLCSWRFCWSLWLAEWLLPRLLRFRSTRSSRFGVSRRSRGCGSTFQIRRHHPCRSFRLWSLCVHR